MTTRAPSPVPLADFLADKGPLTRLHASLCTVYWLTAFGGRRDVTTGEVRAAYPHRAPFLPRIPLPSAVLLRGVEEGLLERVTLLDAAGDDAAPTADRQAYRLTWLGRAVAEALPDLERVGELRGMRHAAPGRGRATPVPSEPGVRPRKR